MSFFFFSGFTLFTNSQEEMEERKEANWMGRSSWVAERSAAAAISDGLNSSILISRFLFLIKKVKN